MTWTQKSLGFGVIKMDVFQLCLSTVQVMCRVWLVPMLLFSIKQDNVMATNRRVTEHLSPLHHRLRPSNLSALRQFEHYMYCQWYPVCRAEQSVALWCCLNSLSCGLSLVLTIWCCLYKWHTVVTSHNVCTNIGRLVDVAIKFYIVRLILVGLCMELATLRYRAYYLWAFVWNWLRYGIEPTICGSLVWNWLRYGIEPTICGPLYGTGYVTV